MQQFYFIFCHPLNDSSIVLRAYAKKDKNIASFTLICTSYLMV